MQAVFTTRYGGPEVLELREVPIPEPKPNQVRIRIHAASVTAGDCELRRSQVLPLFWPMIRAIVGVFRPRNFIQGLEIAGVVDAVGANVTRFAVGDRVFGTTGLGFGGHAEYVCRPAESALALIPDGVDFAAAAGTPIGGMNAMHFLRLAGVGPGDRVLVFGATGNIGVFGIQLARHLGATVDAVCRVPDQVELVRSLGAERVFVDTAEDFAAAGPWDVVFDTIGKAGYRRGLGAVADGGRYVLANPSMGDLFRAPWTTRTAGKRVIVRFADEAVADLEAVAERVATGRVRVEVDRRYPLAQARAAHEYIENDDKNGAVILDVVAP